MPDTPSTPWDIDVDRLMRERNLSLAEARDRMVWDWLGEGDVRPLAALLRDGYEPGYLVRQRLAWMLLDKDNADNLPKDLNDRAPFRLVVRPRSARPPPLRRGRENETRDRLLAENVCKVIADGLTYDEAVNRVAEAAGIGAETVRKAYDPRYGKKARGKLP